MRRGLAAGLGGALLLAYAVHHPLDASPWFDPGQFSLPDLHRLISLFHAVASLALLNASAYAIGAPIHSRLFRRSVPEPLTLPLRLGLGLLALANLVLALAALHLLQPWALALLISVPALVWAVSRIGSGRAALAATSRRRLRGLWSWRAPILGLLLLGPVLQAFGPAVGWDALTYHLALPERYLFVNGIDVTPFSTYTAFPLSTEMLYVVAMGTVGPALAKLIHLEFGCLILGSLFALGRLYSPRCGWLALLFLISEPLFVWELTIAYNDLPLAFYALLALVAAERWLSTADREAVLLAGLLSGACVSIRYPGAALLVAVGAVVLLTPSARSWRERLVACAQMGLLAAAVLSPWLLRNLVFIGNPFAPALQGLFHPPGGEFFDPVAVEQQIAFSRVVGMGRDLGALLALPWNLTMRSVHGLYEGGFGYRIGPLSLLAVVLVLLVPRRPALVRFSLGASGVLVLLWFATSQEARYLLPVYVLLALCGAWALDRLLPERIRHPMSGLWALPLLALLLCHWPIWNRLGHDYADALVRPESELWRRYGPAQELASLLRQNLKQPHLILLVFESRGLLFHGLSYVPYHVHEGSPTLQLIHRCRSPEDLRSRLEALGVTHVVVNSTMQRRYRPMWVDAYQPEDYEEDLQRFASFWQSCTQLLLGGEGVAGAALLPACRGPGPGGVRGRGRP
jgi:hypothetical protein